MIETEPVLWKTNLFNCNKSSAEKHIHLLLKELKNEVVVSVNKISYYEKRLEETKFCSYHWTGIRTVYN